MQKSISTLLIFFCWYFLFSCETTKENEPQHKVNRQSYYQGNLVYTNNCVGCHKKNGKGYGNLYPPLAHSDFLKENPEKSINYIYYGVSDSLVVNGKLYNFQMPNNKHLSREEIADVMTYIGNSWGNNSPSYNVKKINEILK